MRRLLFTAAILNAACFSPTFEARLAGSSNAGDGGCARACGARACGDDGCGGSCGKCVGGHLCDASGLCVAKCPGNVKPCGASCCATGQSCVDFQCATCGCGTRTCGKDACGLACGVCPYPQTCDGAGQCETNCATVLCNGVCCAAGEACDSRGCVPKGCMGKECGDDGQGHVCGVCPTGTGCDVATGRCLACPAAQQCGVSCCSAEQTCLNGVCYSCSCGPKQCGVDACGNSCGACPPDQSCSSSGTCVDTCSCAGKACGDDGCGRSCPPGCAAGLVCLAFQCCARQCQQKQCGDDGCGGTCGDCAYPTYCDPTGVCRNVGCNPPCGLDQTCDHSQMPPYCAQICNPPAGCAANERCDHATGLCLPPTCNGATCQQGQGCYDPQTFGTGNTCTCLPTFTDASGTLHSDTCSSYGKVCDWSWTNIQASTCRKPREFESCAPAVGCDTGFDCLLVSGYRTCLAPCQVSSDCKSLFAYCEPGLNHHCYYNVCADPSCPGGGSSCTASGERAKYFQPCKASRANDGLCVPVGYQDGAGNWVDYGECDQTGTAPSLGACSPEADRTRLSEVCPQGQRCGAIEPDPARPGQHLGGCQAVCNASLQPDPVQACAAQSSCLDVSLSSVAKARLGLCYPSCQVLGTDVCAPDALGNARGCDPFFDGGTGGYCWSRLPSAGAPGAPCQIPTDPDLRDTCGDRLYCSAVASYTCQGFCSTSSCPNSGSTCASCGPSPERCKSGAGPVGVCAP